MAEFSSLMWPKRTPECITARRRPRPDRWRLVRHSTSDHLHQNASENIRVVAMAVIMELTVTDGDAPMLTTTATTIVCCPLSESITQTRLAHGFQVNTPTTPESVKPNQHLYREEGFWNLTHTYQNHSQFIAGSISRINTSISFQVYLIVFVKIVDELATINWIVEIRFHDYSLFSKLYPKPYI